MEKTNITFNRDNRGIIACILIFIIGGLIFFNANHYSNLGAVFPKSVSVLMMVLSLLYIIQTIRRPKPVTLETGGSVFRRLFLFIIMVVWALALETVGFLTTSLIAYALILMLANFNPWSPRSTIIYFASGAAVVILLYLLFMNVLNVPLPKGILL